MAQMDAEKIIQELDRRFALELPEFYKRRIIFWQDGEREFEDKISEITLANAKLVALDGTNTFAIKKLLTVDDQESNYCVYCPESCPDEKNWLLPIQLYSEEFRADLISIWLDEMHLAGNASLRKTLKDYRSFFKTKGHRSKVANLGASITLPVQLQKAIMAVLCGVKSTNPNAIIHAVLLAGIEQSENALYKSFLTYGIDDVFWAMVRQISGYAEEDADLRRMVCHILLTAATRTMQVEHLAGLDSFISLPHQSYCYDLVSEWMHGEDNLILHEIAAEVEEELCLRDRFAKLSIADLADSELFPCINEVILAKLMGEISDHIIDVKVITATAEKRRTCVWYDEVQDYYEGILQVANMQSFFLVHAAGFHTTEAEKVWKEYTSDYYKMDAYYRQFHLAFTHSLQSFNPALDDLFKQVAERAEGLYSHWFLGELGDNWSKVFGHDLAQGGEMTDVSPQRNFYIKYVQPSDTRVFVVISDALRYDVAASLAEQLRTETQAKISLQSCVGIFPTVTKFGMAALLPHRKLTAELRNNGSIGVLADGTPTDAGYRDGILKKANPASVALKYKDIIKMQRAERSRLVKGMKVVYIYHDRIDETSHTDETLVFSACNDAIGELKNMVRIIVNEFGGTRIYLIADHGFLYTYKPLKEDSKVDKSTESAMDVEVDRRYIITKKGAKPKYLLPVKFMDDAQYDAFAPAGTTRIKKKGGGVNFVHGGISLQEMVVPVIEYHYLRNDSKEYKSNKSKYDTKPVPLHLLSANHKISNMIFSLNFYQKEAVGGNREAATYMLYFEDSEGRKVSDVQRIVADKASQNILERQFRCSFNLKSLKFDSRSCYYLVIAEESGRELPQREEFSIDIAFAVDDFDFFS